jgi:hypothetical protein
MSPSKSNIRAGIADNALVVSFLAAEAPRVWRAEMGQLATAALEVQENQGKFSLVMKRSGAPVEEIGTFTGKKEAVEALQLITEALLQGTGITQTEKSGGWFKKLLKFLLTAVIALFLLVALVNIFGRHAPSGQSSYTKAPPAGVPAPADEILGK